MEDNQQLELFSQGQEDNAKATTRRSSSIIARIRRGERIIIFIVAFAVSSIISFSFGVEKGKKMALVSRNTASYVDLAARSVPKVQTAVINIPQSTQVTLSAPQASSQVQGYTIQLASYKSMESAQKEAQLLKKKGLSPLILTKGNYKVLCVGRFTNKETAQPLLSQLSSRYEGCHLRRL